MRQAIVSLLLSALPLIASAQPAPDAYFNRDLEPSKFSFKKVESSLGRVGKTLQIRFNGVILTQEEYSDPWFAADADRDIEERIALFKAELDAANEARVSARLTVADDGGFAWVEPSPQPARTPYALILALKNQMQTLRSKILKLRRECHKEGNRAPTGIEAAKNDETWLQNLSDKTLVTAEQSDALKERTNKLAATLQRIERECKDPRAKIDALDEDAKTKHAAPGKSSREKPLKHGAPSELSDAP